MKKEEIDFFNPISDIEENLDNQFNIDNNLLNILENYEENDDSNLSFEEKMKIDGKGKIKFIT